MIELMFVIIILGIVASIGAEVIATVYKGYIVQRAQHRASLKTELAALQIANRLTSAISGTLYRIKDDGAYESIEAGFSGDGSDYVGLQWVGSDTDSFSTARRPGWSGFCDTNNSTNPNISTQGSALGITNSVITSLAGGIFPSFKPTLHFPNDSSAYTVATPLTAATLTITGTPPSEIYEHYKLAWTSYTLVVEANAEGGDDLMLYYNFAPASKAAYAGASKSLVLHNVSTFRFKGAGRTLRFKLCKQERISKDVNVTSCKEKAVF